MAGRAAAAAAAGGGGGGSDGVARCAPAWAERAAPGCVASRSCDLGAAAAALAALLPETAGTTLTEGSPARARQRPEADPERSQPLLEATT